MTIKVMLRPYRGAPVIRDVPITIPLQATRGTHAARAGERFGFAQPRAQPVCCAGTTGQPRTAHHSAQPYAAQRPRVCELLKPTPTLMVEDKELPGAPLSQMNVLNQNLPPDSVLLRETVARRMVGAAGRGHRRHCVGVYIKVQNKRLARRRVLCL